RVMEGDGADTTWNCNSDPGGTLGTDPLGFEKDAGGGSSIGRSINGLLPSNNATTPLTTIDVAPGSACDVDQTVDIILSAGLTKTEGAWSDGDDAGGLDSGSTFAADTGYHIHLIYNPTSEAVDVLFSTSAAAPAMPGGFTKRRRIGCFMTD